jgi:hypothetical protein
MASAFLRMVLRTIWRGVSSEVGKKIAGAIVSGVLTGFTVRELATLFSSMMVLKEMVSLCQAAGTALKNLSTWIDKLPHDPPWTSTLASDIDSPYLAQVKEGAMFQMKSIAEEVLKKQGILEKDHLSTQLVMAFLKNNLNDGVVSVSKAQDALSDLGKDLLKKAKEESEK